MNTGLIKKVFTGRPATAIMARDAKKYSTNGNERTIRGLSPSAITR